MNKQKSELVTCRGCDGTGYSRFALGREINCVACEGVGKVLMKSGETWCNRCNGRGEVMKGIPGLETYGLCPICGGKGRKKVQ